MHSKMCSVQVRSETLRAVNHSKAFAFHSRILAYFNSGPLRALLAKGLGCSSPSLPSWVRTAQMAIGDQFVCRMYGEVLSGLRSTVVDTRAAFEAQKESSQSSVHWKGTPFLVSMYRGLAMAVKPSTN